MVLVGFMLVLLGFQVFLVDSFFFFWLGSHSCGDDIGLVSLTKMLYISSLFY